MQDHICHPAGSPTPDIARPRPDAAGRPRADHRTDAGASNGRGPAKPKVRGRAIRRHPASSAATVPRPFGADAVNPFRKQDLAFQRAMKRAVARGREHPPMMCVHRDERPIDTRCAFAPVPHHSGCVSPASYCAELAGPGRNDAMSLPSEPPPT